jgi:hypothetical protein
VGLGVWVRTPFLFCSGVKIRAGLVRTSVVKMHHFITSRQHFRSSLSHCSSYVRHTSIAILIAWYELIFWRIVLSFCKMTVPYPGYRVWSMTGGEVAILFTVWRQHEGGTEKNFSRQEHLFTISLQQLRPAYLHCHSNCLISSQIFWRIALSFCKMTVPYPGYRIVEEVYVKYKFIELTLSCAVSKCFDINENDNLRLIKFSY